MRNRLYLFCLTILSFSAISQKVDMDRKLLSVNHTAFPENNTLKDFNSFTVSVSAPRGFLAIRHISRSELENKLSLNGFRRVKTGGDFIMDVIIKDKIVVEHALKNEQVVDLKGKKTTMYFHRYSFYIPINVRLLKKSGEVIYSEAITDIKNLKVYKSDSSPDYNKVKDNADNKFWSTSQKLIQEYVTDAFVEIPAKLNDNFGYGKTSAWVPMYELDSKKHPEYLAYKTAFDTLKTILKSVAPGCDIKVFRQRAEDPIKYFESLIPKLSATDKEQFELLEATITNLMLINFYTDNFIKYREYADKLLSLNEKGDNEKYKVKDLERIEKRMKNSGCSSIYYLKPVNGEEYISDESKIEEATIDSSALQTEVIKVETKSDSVVNAAVVPTTPANAINPSPYDENFDFSTLKKYPADIVYRGSFTDTLGKITYGYYIISGENEDHLRFYGRAQNTRFTYLVDKKPQKFVIEATNYDSLVVNGRVFKPLVYKDPLDILGKTQKNVMEVIVENSAAQMYRFHPAKVLKAGDPLNWVFNKKGLEKPVSITKSDLFWKKKLKDFFSDCPAIAQEVDDMSLLSLSPQNKFKGWCEKYEGCVGAK